MNNNSNWKNNGLLGNDALITMYRAPGSHEEIKVMRQGFTLSKAMKNWKQPFTQDVGIRVNDKIYPRLVPPSAYSRMGPVIIKDKQYCFNVDALLKMESLLVKLHTVSSSQKLDNDPPISDSIFLSFTSKLEVAKSFSGIENGNTVFQVSAWKSDFWKGGIEDEWLLLGGTNIYNVKESRNRGSSFLYCYPETNA